jgi:hypothetical protein
MNDNTQKNADTQVEIVVQRYVRKGEKRLNAIVQAWGLPFHGNVVDHAVDVGLTDDENVAAIAFETAQDSGIRGNWCEIKSRGRDNYVVFLNVDHCRVRFGSH